MVHKLLGVPTCFVQDLSSLKRRKLACSQISVNIEDEERPCMIDLDYRFLIKRIDLHKAILETGRDDRYTYINYKVGLAMANGDQDGRWTSQEL